MGEARAARPDRAGQALVFTPSDERYFVGRDVATTSPFANSAVDGYMASPIDDEIMWTAIVIKDTPFTVKRETLLAIISSLSIPAPYAFNYHPDTQSQLRGLAGLDADMARADSNFNIGPEQACQSHK
ncbi:hypothetical protein FRC09_008178 [Ceratobasidium sp. 395]|nr:hypothetical protein FRC09_008178 [Ceratobasidium sp. 395]